MLSALSAPKRCWLLSLPPTRNTINFVIAFVFWRTTGTIRDAVPPPPPPPPPCVLSVSLSRISVSSCLVGQFHVKKTVLKSFLALMLYDIALAAEIKFQDHSSSHNWSTIASPYYYMKHSWYNNPKFILFIFYTNPVFFFHNRALRQVIEH